MGRIRSVYGFGKRFRNILAKRDQIWFRALLDCIFGTVRPRVDSMSGAHFVLRPSKPAIILAIWIARLPLALLGQQLRNSEFVGSSGCAVCHADLVRSYAVTPMARSSGKLQGNALPEFLKRSEFLHASSGVRYHVVKENDRYFMDFVRQASESAPAIQGRRELIYFVGSGEAAQGYLFGVDNFLFQAPVSYYTRRRQWDIAPGYKMDSHLDLMRPVQRNCLECHSTGVQAVGGTRNGYQEVPFLEGGISCERCHGPGKKHVEQMIAGDSSRGGSIVNPIRLDPVRRDSVCAVCHLTGEVSVARAGHSLSTFQAGERLSDHSVPFIYSKSKDHPLKVIGHFEKLWQSRCKASSGDKLWCVSCHDPHRVPVESERIEYYRARCERCHQDSGCRVPLPVRRKRGNDCTVCHMPKTQAADGGHSAFTDHSIPRHANRSSLCDGCANNKLLPFWTGTGEDRELGLAYAKLASQEPRPELVLQALQLLEGVIAAGSEDTEVWLQYGYLHELRGDEDQALQWYQRAYSKDPSLVEAAVNLGAKYARRGLYPEAIRLWSEVVTRNPGLEVVQINLAMAYLRIGDIVAARRLLLKALADNPDLSPARKLLQDLRLKPLPRVEAK